MAKPQPILFDESDNSDTEEVIKINNSYAKNYDNWRQKEELNKLKTKYGEDALDGSDEESSSSDEDSDGALITEEFEKDFFTTLASLKNKDPKIYDESVRFFKDTPEGIVKTKKTKDQPTAIKDYERKLILQNDENVSDEETERIDDSSNTKSKTYFEQKKKLAGMFNDDDKSDDSSDEDEFKEREQPKESEKDCKQFLLGEKGKIGDEEMESTLKPLQEFWTDPKIDPKEKFLRDYILNKRFLASDDKDYVPTYDEILKEDVEDDKLEEFEHKYNFRFEEPDQEFIKRYPRTMENSVRQQDDRRKVKRAELKERKQREKDEKMRDIENLKAMKRKEIEEKIKMLKEVTGNTELNIEDEDIDGDFDPEAHDKRMQKLFDEDFYQGEEGDQKPEFPDLDEELDIERWDKFEEVKEDDAEDNEDVDDDPHCEDDNFIMDCDYDASAVKPDDGERRKKKRKRKSKFAEVISEPKPVFNPNNKTYAEYLDEYYKLDCEDIIGDIPCRFKYRDVIPNSFGLSVEEILAAKDKELNRWCSLKKAMQYRPDHVEKYDVIAFSKRAANEELKKKLLPSLYSDESVKVNKKVKVDTSSDNKEIKNEVVETETNKKPEVVVKTKKAKKIVRNEASTFGGTDKIKKGPETKEEIEIKEDCKMEEETIDGGVNPQQNKKKKKKLQKDITKTAESTDSKPKNIKTDIKTEATTNPETDSKMSKTQRRKMRRNKVKNITNNTSENKPISAIKHGDKEQKLEVNGSKVSQKNRKRKFTETASAKKNGFKKAKVNDGDDGVDISDARLQAFGLNPKKFKNKLKYGKKSA